MVYVHLPCWWFLLCELFPNFVATQKALIEELYSSRLNYYQRTVFFFKCKVSQYLDLRVAIPVLFLPLLNGYVEGLYHFTSSL